MTRQLRRVRIFALWAIVSQLTGLGIGAARADGVTLTASFGIAGRYRPGGWCPVTVIVQNPNGETLSGQAQALAANDPGRQNPGNSALTTSLFAHPISLSGSGPQSVVLYTRGMDPGQQTITVQIADGHERGDGRILAQTDNLPSNNAPTITGTPVAENDLFLVGFGGDPGAFTYLSGQRLGLVHSSGGMALLPSGGRLSVGPGQAINGNGVPATTQVAMAGAADLPDKAEGYSGVDAVLLRSDAPLDSLTEAQTEALKGWVATGGHLIVCGGVDATRFGSAFFSGLLPASIGAVNPAVMVPGIGQVGALTLTPKPLPGVRVLSYSAATGPLVVSGPYGAGCVTLTAYDPTSKPFQTPTVDVSSLWQPLLTAGQTLPSSVIGHVAAREENYTTSNYYYGGSQPLLSNAVMRAPSLDAPGTEVIGLFLLVYLIALVPANYLILKRLDRKELAWVTIPALVLIFAVGTFGVGYAAKGGTVFVNRAAIVEASSGSRQAGIYAEIGLFSPHRTSYDITLPGANALAAVPNPGTDGYRNRSSGDTEMPSDGQTRFTETSAGVSLLDTSINMWAMRAFDTQSTTDLGGTVDGMLMEKPGPPASKNTSWGIQGTVINRLPTGLTECQLLYHGQWQSLGDLTSGATVSVNIPAGTSVSQAGLSLPSLRGAVDPGDSQSDIHQRMRAALADYARSLGQAPPNFYNNGQAPSPSVYTPAPGEALLLGWSNDPALAGPMPRVDGHSVRENDVTLVVIHLPVAPSPVVE